MKSSPLSKPASSKICSGPRPSPSAIIFIAAHQDNIVVRGGRKRGKSKRGKTNGTRRHATTAGERRRRRTKPGASRYSRTTDRTYIPVSMHALPAIPNCRRLCPEQCPENSALGNQTPKLGHKYHTIPQNTDKTIMFYG